MQVAYSQRVMVMRPPEEACKVRAGMVTYGQ